jgi:hypothetical protein
MRHRAGEQENERFGPTVRGSAAGTRSDAREELRQHAFRSLRTLPAQGFPESLALGPWKRILAFGYAEKPQRAGIASELPTIFDSVPMSLRGDAFGDKYAALS